MAGIRHTSSNWSRSWAFTVHGGRSKIEPKTKEKLYPLELPVGQMGAVLF